MAWDTPAGMEFKPVVQQKGFLRVAAQLREAIERGDYGPGDMLPSERELCRQMDVSRPVMREAMSALQLLGIIRTRAGLGTFVNEAAPAPAGWSLRPEDTPEDVIEARQVVEPSGARLAATRLTDERAGALERLLEEMREATREPADAMRFVKLDLRFHQAVADASGNELISRFVAAVVGYSNQRLRRALREETFHSSERLCRLYLEHHESIYSHLVQGSGDQAAQAMFRHLLATQAAQGAQWQGDGWEQARAAILGSLPEHAPRGSEQGARPLPRRHPPRT